MFLVFHILNISYILFFGTENMHPGIFNSGKFNFDNIRVLKILSGMAFPFIKELNNYVTRILKLISNLIISHTYYF